MGDLHAPRAIGSGPIACRAHELQLRGDGEAAQQIGGENSRAFEDRDDDEGRFDVGVDLRDLSTQLAHSFGDPVGGDHRLAGGAPRSRTSARRLA